MKIVARAEWQASEAEPKPALAFLPGGERRRLTELERAVLQVVHEVMPEGRELPVVMASRWGEIGVTLKLMRQFHEEREMSPAGFSNSVHNAAAGHVSRLHGNHATYTAVAAGAESYAMGLLEASTYPGEVIFVYAEESTPEFYRPHFGPVERAHAVALLIDNRE